MCSPIDQILNQGLNPESWIPGIPGIGTQFTVTADQIINFNFGDVCTKKTMFLYFSVDTGHRAK